MSSNTTTSTANTATTPSPSAPSPLPTEDSLKAEGLEEAEVKREEMLWEDVDTAKEIKDSDATEGFENIVVQPEHYALAVRALAYGTVVAVVGVTLSSAFACWYAGFTSFAEVSEYIKSGPSRRASKLEEEGGTVYHHTVDLLDPSSWNTAWERIITDIERIEATERKAENKE